MGNSLYVLSETGERTLVSDKALTSAKKPNQNNPALT
jgi:hypothetical protein